MGCCGRKSGGNKRVRALSKDLPSNAQGRRIQVIAGPYAGKAGTVISRPRLGVFRVQLDGESIKRDFYASLLRY